MKRSNPFVVPGHCQRLALSATTAAALLSLAACGGNDAASGTGYSDPSQLSAGQPAGDTAGSPPLAEGSADAYTELPAPNAGIDFDAEPRHDGIPPGNSGDAASTGTLDTKAVAATASAARIGAWGPQVKWPFIPIHAIVLPDGRVMTYGSQSNGEQGSKFQYDVWDPAAGTDEMAHLTLPNTTQVDIFCSAQVVLPGSGELFIAGGDVFSDRRGRSTNQPNNDTTLFRPASNSIEKSNPLLRPRWYASTTVLPNGEVFIQGGKGGNDHPEIRRLNGTQSLLSGISTSDLREDYPRNWVAPDGKVFGFSRQQMYRIDPSGQGTRTDLGTLDYQSDWEGSAVMYRPGRILMTEAHGNGAAIIDIRGKQPVVSDAGKMSNTRMWHNSTVLADGTVAVSGGAEYFDFSKATARNPIYQIDLWDPATNRWTRGAAQKRMRLYHSTAVLLPDGSLFSGGGGAGGPETNLNAEIYYPPYLYAADGSPAPRPQLTAAPTVTDPGGTLTLQSPDAASIRRVTMVATGSVTHSFDMNQRFIELEFRRDGNSLVAQLPANAHDTPPGYYMVFILNQAGTPSLARMVRVNVQTAAQASPPATSQPAKPQPPAAPAPASYRPVPVYRYVAPGGDNDMRYVFSTDPSIRGEWTRQGVAFNAYSSQAPGTVPVYRYRARDRQGRARYLVSTDANLGNGWTRELTAFYAYTRRQPGTQAVNEFYRSYYGWYLGYSTSNKFGTSSAWRPTRQTFYVPTASAAR